MKNRERPLPELRRKLAQWAADSGLTADTLTIFGALSGVLAFFYFWFGDYWLGLGAALVFLFAEAVAGELERLSSDKLSWRGAAERALGVIVAPLWSWAWAHGLAAYGTPLEPVYRTMVVATIVIGYFVQRAIEARFRARFGIAMRSWRPIDSRFRLLAAGRDSDLAILALLLMAGHPDAGLELVALWTILSVIFEMVRLAQAEMQAWRGLPPTPWRAHV